jgi:endoglucanase
VRDGSSADTNFGTAASLVAYKAPATGHNRWTYVRFDTSAMSTVGSARLRLFGGVIAPLGGTVRTQAFSVASSSWSETDLSWNNKPATGSTLNTVTITSNSTAERWYEWNVTAYVRQEKAAGRHVITLALKNETLGGPQVMFHSREAETQPPELVLTP